MAKAKQKWVKPAGLRRNAAAASLRTHGHRVVPDKRAVKLAAAVRREGWA
jgi:hypothetical protein